MQAVILAGGKGIRLRPVTYKKPKPMVEINGRPFLEYQIELLKKFGINQFLILTGYLGAAIEDYFEQGEKLAVEIKYCREKQALGTGGALKNAEHLLCDEFLLLNGDTYLPIDYTNLIQYYKQNKAAATLVIYDNRSKPISPSNLDIDSNSYIIKYDKKNSAGLNFIDAGAGIWQKKILELIPETAEISLEKETFPKLIAEKQLLAYPVKQRFYDMGTTQGLELLKTILH